MKDVATIIRTYTPSASAARNLVEELLAELFRVPCRSRAKLKICLAELKGDEAREEKCKIEF